MPPFPLFLHPSPLANIEPWKLSSVAVAAPGVMTRNERKFVSVWKLCKQHLSLKIIISLTLIMEIYLDIFFAIAIRKRAPSRFLSTPGNNGEQKVPGRKFPYKILCYG